MRFAGAPFPYPDFLGIPDYAIVNFRRQLLLSGLSRLFGINTRVLLLYYKMEDLVITI